MDSGWSVFAVGRRSFLRYICSLPTLSLGGCHAATPCPLCGGPLSSVGSHIDFRFLRSVNYAVWDRSSDHVGCVGYEPYMEAKQAAPGSPQVVTCAPEFTSDSPFCKRCFHAFSQRDQHWVRWMDSPKSFVLPLSREILEFPLPEKSFILYNVGYEQIFGGRSGNDYYSDAISFWYKAAAPPSAAAGIEEYVRLHKLQFGLELAKTPGQTYVNAIYTGSRPKLAKT
jgi:hypothetical protein